MTTSAAPERTIVSDDETRPPAEWSDEEVVAHIWRHLRTQGRKSVVRDEKMIRNSTDEMWPTGSCAYRTETEDGGRLACAVGCLLPDRLYVPRMDSAGGCAAYILAQPYPEAGSWLGTSEARRALLGDAQSAHDFAGSLRGAALELVSVCSRHGVVEPEDLSDYLRETA